MELPTELVFAGYAALGGAIAWLARDQKEGRRRCEKDGAEFRAKYAEVDVFIRETLLVTLKESAEQNAETVNELSRARRLLVAIERRHGITHDDDTPLQNPLRTKEAAPDTARPNMRAGLWLLCFVPLLFSGCTATRAERQADTEKRDTFTVEGHAAVPMPQGGTSLVPVSFTVERLGSERLIEHSESKTQIDGAAIAQQVGAVVGKSLDAAVAKLTGLQMSAPSAGGITTAEGTLAGTLGGLALFAGREYMARRRLVRQRDELQEQSVELAKQIPPTRPDGRMDGGA